MLGRGAADKLQISDGQTEVTVIRSNRRTMAIQINDDLSVTVRAPMRASRRDIERMLQEKDGWIQKHIDQLRENKAKLAASGAQQLTDEKIRELKNKALQYIPERTAYYARIIGVYYGRITIRKQKTRWGSCSSKGNLNFNCLLMLAPPEVIDYVVVHELCHRKQMNHSKAFWDEVAKILPDYKTSEKWLKNEGSQFMRQL